MTEKLIEKYEAELANLIVMDDYDGGKAETLRIVIEDLKKTNREQDEKLRNN